MQHSIVIAVCCKNVFNPYRISGRGYKIVRLSDALRPDNFMFIQADKLTQRILFFGRPLFSGIGSKADRIIEKVSPYFLIGRTPSRTPSYSVIPKCKTGTFVAHYSVHIDGHSHSQKSISVTSCLMDVPNLIMSLMDFL